jgi:hypothetical protein
MHTSKLARRALSYAYVCHIGGEKSLSKTCKHAQSPHRIASTLKSGSLCTHGSGLPGNQHCQPQLPLMRGCAQDPM